MFEQPRPRVSDQPCRQPRIPALVPDRDDRGDDARDREHAEDLVQRLEILLAERVVDQEFQAQRHDDVEQRLHQHAESDERYQFPVVAEMRPDEAVDRGQCAGGFLGGEDDEILVIIIVVVEFQFVVLAVVTVIVGRRAGCLAAGGRSRRDRLQGELLREFRIVRRRGLPIIRRRRLWRHETNRCCTAGMTAKTSAVAANATAAILCDRDEFGKQLALPVRIHRHRPNCLVVGFDLVEERIAQAVGVGVPLPRPLVGGERRRPQRVGAVAAMHREVESVAEEQL